MGPAVSRIPQDASPSVKLVRWVPDSAAVCKSHSVTGSTLHCNILSGTTKLPPGGAKPQRRVGFGCVPLYLPLTPAPSLSWTEANVQYLLKKYRDLELDRPSLYPLAPKVIVKSTMT